MQQQEYTDKKQLYTASKSTQEEPPTPPERPRRAAKRVLVALLCMLLLALCVLQLFTGASAPVLPQTPLPAPQQTAGTQAVEVAVVGPGNMARTYQTSGLITTGKRVTVYSPVGAPVREVFAELGTRVQSGQKLLAFGTVDLERKLRMAEAERELADIKATGTADKSNGPGQVVADGQAAIDEKQTLCDEAKSTLASLRVQKQQLEQQLRNAEAELAQLRERLEELRREYEIFLEQQQQAGQALPEPAALLEQIAETETRIEELTYLTDGYKKQIEEYALAIAAAEADIQNREEEIAAAQKAHDAQSKDILTEEERRQLELQRVNPQVAYETARDNLSAAQKGIVAPIGGVVTRLSVEAGAMAGQYTAVCTIESTEEVNVTVALDKDSLEWVREGQSATVRTAGQQYTATVRKIEMAFLHGADVEEKGFVNATVALDRTDASLRLGVEADVEIVTGAAENVLTVPKAALRTGQNGQYCLVVQRGVLVRREVETGFVQGDFVEVRSGLSAGEIVAIAPLHMAEGTAVSAVGATPAAPGATPAAGSEQALRFATRRGRLKRQARGDG